MADAKRLARNTLFMYARMILIMIVSIYTSRVVLDKLGVDDYGLYNAVASIVAIVVFLNTTLSTSTSRFLTYDLGKGDTDALRLTFSTSVYAHLILAGIIVVLLETIGIWYMTHKFVIPEGRESAVDIVFHISVLMTAITVIRVPYTATIVAHESMDTYAYIGIADAFLRLGVAYVLSFSLMDKLILYAVLLTGEHLVVTFAYYIVGRKKYTETKLVRGFSRDTFGRMMSFTGWTAVANLSNTMIVQGAVVLLNLFFSPAIIAAKALADQITNAVMQFIENFRMALNPQIIKSYAAGEIEEFKKWSLLSTIVSFNLMMVLGLPVMVAMSAIFDIWLVEVPPMAVEFTRLAILAQIIGSISSSTYIPFVASGKLKLNAYWGLFTGIGYFLVLYFIFKLGAGALWVQWLYLAIMLLSVLVLRPYLLHREIGFSYGEFYHCVWSCFKPMLVASLVAYGLRVVFQETLLQQVVLFILVFFTTCLIVWFFLEKPMRDFILKIVKSKMHK